MSTDIQQATPAGPTRLTLWQRLKAKLNAIFNPRQPMIGEVWKYVEDDSPWPRKGGLVVILDLQDDWVRFAAGSWDDRRRKLSDFMVYHKFQSEPTEISMRLVGRFNGTYQEPLPPPLPEERDANPS
jgi:hypothetical protein